MNEITTERQNQIVAVQPNLPLANIETHLVATRPEDVATAQRSLAEFFSAKLEQAKREWDDCQASYDAASAADSNLNLAPFSRQVSRSKKRFQFYEKCLLAVQAGYVIVPSFPGMDRFMIRTKKKKPLKAESNSRWNDFPQLPQVLPVGDGENKDSLPEVYQRTYLPGQLGENEKEVVRFFPESFRDQVEYPMSVAHPTVISELDKAAKMKIFDDFGVSPSRRAKGDPIVVGRIYRPNQKPDFGGGNSISFLVAWYLDTRTI